MKYARRILAALVAILTLSLFSQGNVHAAWLVLFVGSAATVPWSAAINNPVFGTDIAIPGHYIRSYSANWDHTVQQETEKLARIVTLDSFEGKEKVYTDINQVSFTERTERLAKTVLKEITGAKRKMTRRDFSCHYVFDRSDKEFLALLGEPDSELQAEMRMAFKRSLDDGIIAAASGTVYGGEDPHVTPITLGNDQKVAVDYVTVGTDTNTGLTPDKLQRAIKLFEDNDLSITDEEFVLAISPRQKEDLFQYVKSAPNDGYAAMIGAWLENPSKKLFGFTVIISTRLAVASSIRTCLAWSRRGIYACPDKLEIKVDLRPDLEHARQISAYGQWGFMRRREERVVEIKCDESLG